MEEEAGFQHRPVSMVNILPLRLTSTCHCVVSEGGGCSGPHTPLQHTTGWRSSAGTPDWAASPSLRVRTGELEWGRGDHRQRTIPPVVRSPPEKQLVWRASSLHQASYMSPLLTHTPGVGAIINLVLYVGDCSTERSGNFHEVTEEA